MMRVESSRKMGLYRLTHKQKSRRVTYSLRKETHLTAFISFNNDIQACVAPVTRMDEWLDLITSFCLEYVIIYVCIKNINNNNKIIICREKICKYE